LELVSKLLLVLPFSISTIVFSWDKNDDLIWLQPIWW